MTDIEAAWDRVFDALPSGWSVGRPSYHDERHVWTQYAFDSVEVAKVGLTEPGVDGDRRDRARVPARDGALSARDQRGPGAGVGRHRHFPCQSQEPFREIEAISKLGTVVLPPASAS